MRLAVRSMRKLTARIVAAVAIIVCLIILIEPFLLTVLMLYSGSRVISISMTGDETLFHFANSGTNPFQFSFLELPTWRVILWGLAILPVMCSMLAVALRWWHQTGALSALNHRNEMQ